MANLNNINVPSVIGRGFLALAEEAGLTDTLTSILTLAQDEKTLLANVKAALFGPNPELADALNLDTLRLYLEYLERVGDPPLVYSRSAPTLIDEDGPASVVAADWGNDTYGVTFSEPTAEQRAGGAAFETYKYEIYANGVFMKSGNVAASGGFINESYTLVGAGSVLITRVLFINDNNEQSRFGPLHTLNL